MRFLRSNLFVLVTVLLVLGSYAGCVLDDCDGESANQAKTCQTEGCGNAHHNGEGAKDETTTCPCLCHQIFTHERRAPGWMAEPLVTISTVIPMHDFAPDGVPEAIDHPPQLA